MRSWVPTLLIVGACTGDPERPVPETDCTECTTPPTGDSPLLFRGDPPRNVVFLSIDTLRRDHVGAYGDLGLTPFLDEVADQSVVLEDHTQCSNWTFGSATCTLAGRTNVERGHLPRLNGNKESRPPVPDGTEFLATWLAEAGMYSIIVSGNSWLGPNWGNTQGFDEVLRPGGSVERAGLTALAAADARGDIEGGFFLHLHFMEPHASYNPAAEFVEGEDELEPWPEDLRNRGIHYGYRDTYNGLSEPERVLLEAHLRVLYAGEVRAVDAHLARTWLDLEAAGYLDDTLVVVWTDHGEQFWEHGNQTHAYLLHPEESAGVAFFWADNIVPGRWSEPTAAIDLVPTVLEVLDLPIPPAVTGLPLGSAAPGRAIFQESLARRGGVQSVLRDQQRLQYEWRTGEVQLFDRTTDPLELVDRYRATDPTVLELWALLKPQVEAMAPLVVDGSPAPVWPTDLP